MIEVWAYSSFMFLASMTYLLLVSGAKTSDKKKIFVGMIFLCVASFGLFCLLINKVIGI